MLWNERTLSLTDYNKISECSKSCALYVLPIYYITNIDGFCHLLELMLLQKVLYYVHDASVSIFRPAFMHYQYLKIIL